MTEPLIKCVVLHWSAKHFSQVLMSFLLLLNRELSPSHRPALRAQMAGGFLGSSRRPFNLTESRGAALGGVPHLGVQSEPRSWGD